MLFQTKDMAYLIYTNFTHYIYINMREMDISKWNVTKYQTAIYITTQGHGISRIYKFYTLYIRDIYINIRPLNANKWKCPNEI